MNIASTPVTSGTRSVRASARRMWSLARAELRLLIRNRMALFMTMAMPVVSAFLFAGLDEADQPGVSMGATVIVVMANFTILLVVYYNLVATYAARREDLVLKRLRSGELTDAEIIAGTAVASVVTALAQIVAIGVAAPLLFDVAPPVNVVLMVVAVVLGTIAWIPLAAASSIFTRNAEMAQLTTLPALLICLFFSGIFVPLHMLPDAMARIGEFMPLTPVVELMRMGLVGVTNDGSTVDFAASFGAAITPVAILLAWTYLGVTIVRRYFRWEPRR